MIAKTRIHRRNRGLAGPEDGGQTLDATATASISAGKLLLTLDKPVVRRGLPAGVTVEGLGPTAAEQTSPTTILLTYAAPVAAGQDWAIANKEPHIRTAEGGYVAAAGGTFPIS